MNFKVGDIVKCKKAFLASEVMEVDNDSILLFGLGWVCPDEFERYKPKEESLESLKYLDNLFGNHTKDLRRLAMKVNAFSEDLWEQVNEMDRKEEEALKKMNKLGGLYQEKYSESGQVKLIHD